MIKRLLMPALYIAGKDIYSEWKTKQTVTTMLVFSALIIVTFSFAFDPSNQVVSTLIPGMIWIITIFAAILGLNKSFVIEQVDDRIHGFIIAPIDPASIFLGKFIANFVFVLIVQVISIPLLFLLFDFNALVIESIPYLIGIILLGTFGFICAGTLFAALAANSRSSEMLLPILLFPLATPVLIAAIQATEIVLLDLENLSNAISWMQLITVYDIVFFVGGLILFEYILEV